MSWLGDFTDPNGPSRAIQRDEGPKVDDGTGRMVSDKAANQPFLAHKKWRLKEEARKLAKAERKRIRAEKLARGEPVEPDEDEDEDEDEEIGCIGLIKFLVYATVFVLLLSKFITGDWLWEYRGKWTNSRTYFGSSQRIFSEVELAKYDGSDPKLPIYLAIDGVVYDVSSGARSYGKGGSYNLMTGTDATRAFGTGCFKDHRTHDLRGLTEAQMKGVKHWIKFFAEHKTYFKVGRITHKHIDPESPIPPDCKPKTTSQTNATPLSAKATEEGHAKEL